MDGTPRPWSTAGGDARARGARIVAVGLLVVATVSCHADTSSRTEPTRTTQTSTTQTSTTQTSTTVAGDSPGDWGRLGGADHAYVGQGPTVVILGDSLVMMSRGALRKALTGTSARIVGRAGEGFSGGGQSSAWGHPLMLELAASLRGENPDVAVIALGTNDALSPRLGLPAALQAWSQIREDLSGSCIVAVTVSETATAEHYDQRVAMELNRQLRADADVIVDWSALGSGARYTRPDDIHPTSEGQTYYAELIRDGIDQCISGQGT